MVAYLTLAGIEGLSDVAGFTLGSILASHHAQLIAALNSDLVCVCIPGNLVELVRTEIARDVPRVQIFDALRAAA